MLNLLLLQRTLVLRSSSLCKTLSRKYCSPPHVKSYEVSSACNINAYLACKTIVIPNEPTTEQTEQLKIVCDKQINVSHIGESINLTSVSEPGEASSTCELHVPLKSNINLTALGNVKVGNLNGDAIRIFSESGNVIVGNCQSKEIALGTINGTITTEGVLEATMVSLLAKKKGNIVADKIKALGLKVETTEGTCSMESCYADESYFLTKSGKLNLNNVHKKCRVETLKDADLNLVGFEGCLSVTMQQGKADIHIQQLHDNSDIVMREDGNVNLRVSPEFLEKCEAIIWSPNCQVHDKIPYEEDEEKDLVRIVADKSKTPEFALRVRCEKGTVRVYAANWIDMMQKKLQNN